MSSEEPAKPKLIIDDDWKSRVEAEKEQLRKKAPADEPTDEMTEEAEPPLPAASFSTLVSTLVTQALTCLGQLPDPITNKPILRAQTAKHLIDTLDVLEKKTKGNLTSAESAMLTNVLHELRMAFVAITTRK